MPLDHLREGEAIGALLLQKKRVSADQLEAARKEAAGRGGRLATVLYAMGAVDLGSLVKALAEAHDTEAIPPERMAALDPKVVQTLPKRVCLRALAIPVRRSERGLDVAFVDPADEAAIRDVQKSSADPVTVVVTAEPLVWYALRVHGVTDKIPKHLEPLVDELVNAGLSSAPKRAPITPRDGADEYNTTPLGGVAPQTPDEHTTAKISGGETIDVDAITGSPDDAWPLAEAALDEAKDESSIGRVLVAFARTGSSAACLLRHEDGAFAVHDGAGALASSSASVPADKPNVLTAALAGETGFRGAIPPGSAALPIFGGRSPKEILLLALRRTKGEELLVYAESGAAALDAAFVERLRVLTRRARSTLE